MPVTGLDFVALQVRDLEASARFYEERLGLERAEQGPPHAVVFATSPIPFAVREPLPGVDLDASDPRPGIGVALWFKADDAQALCDELRRHRVRIVAEPVDGPFGRTFSLEDPDGYVVTVHDQG